MLIISIEFYYLLHRTECTDIDIRKFLHCYQASGTITSKINGTPKVVYLPIITYGGDGTYWLIFYIKSDCYFRIQKSIYIYTVMEGILG